MPIVDELRRRLHHLEGISLAALMGAGPGELPEGLLAFGAPVGGYRPPGAEVMQRSIDGPHGAIPVRVYRPPARAGVSPAPGLVWAHGGAFVAGDLDMPEADVVARELCALTRGTVVSVDYRLAVDGVHFPVPHDDVVAAWRWTSEHCGALGIDPRRLSLGGASAGANLAAGAALRARDEGRALPWRLLLAYPVLHDELPAPAVPPPADMDLIPEMLRFPPEAVSGLNRNYLGGAAPSPYAFPALGDVAGLPPLAIVTCEYDDLRPSGDAFAAQARAGGVPVIVQCEPGVPHGHLNIPGLPAAERSLRFFAAEMAGVSAPVR